tara:strand:+ start:869 stop:2047 length:1179 start_codon:yes stop_codon:yes gene_type:complete
MSRLRLAQQLGGDRLEAAADALLNDVLGSKRYGKTREADYVFPDDELNLGNVDEAITRLGARTPAKLTYGSDGAITDILGGNVIRNKKGGINIDQVPSPQGRDYVKYSPSVVDSTKDPLVEAQLYPERFEGATGALGEARDMGMAHRNNDYEAYRAINNRMSVTPEALDRFGSLVTKGKAEAPIARGMSTGGAITGSRGDTVLIPGTERVFSSLGKDEKAAYLKERGDVFLGQWLQQKGRSMGTAQTQIFPPGTPSHMDHIQSLSSSIDAVGPEKGWGYSDEPTNFSYLDSDYNVNTKLNYDLQATHQLGRMADTMRQAGYGDQLPPNLTQKQLGNKDRQRLTQEEAVKDLIVRTVRPNNTEDLDYALKLLRQAEDEQSSWKSIDDDLDRLL